MGDSQVRADRVHVAALELTTQDGTVGLGFVQQLFVPLPDLSELDRLFHNTTWATLEGAIPLSLTQRVQQPRGGNLNTPAFDVREAVQVALWDLAAKQVDLPLWKLLGAVQNKVPAYASGLDFHLEDDAFCALFGAADAAGYGAFKIKLGHADFDRDLHRLDLLRKTVRKGAPIMVDANEAWSAKEAVMKLERIRDAGHDLLWVEDPILRSDFDGLRMLRTALPWTQVNAGEYLGLSDKRRLLEAGATDMLNVHGHLTDVMRAGWLAAERGIPVTLGNTFLEVGVHAAVALPSVNWLEYSFQNFDHLVEQPVQIVDGMAIAPDRPGHGLVLSDTARATAQPYAVDVSEQAAE